MLLTRSLPPLSRAPPLAAPAAAAPPEDASPHVSAGPGELLVFAYVVYEPGFDFSVLFTFAEGADSPLPFAYVEDALEKVAGVAFAAEHIAVVPGDAALSPADRRAAMLEMLKTKPFREGDEASHASFAAAERAGRMPDVTCFFTFGE